MKERYLWRVCVFLLLCLLVGISSVALAQDVDEDLFDDSTQSEGPIIADPLEPLNRAFFQFNDKLYFWVLKPISRSYTSVVHVDITLCLANIFRNILAPIRIVNNFLQGKFHDSGVELSRFVINTTAGMGGLADPAKEVFGLDVKKEDFGQTLGSYGVGEGIYICWPLFGPSNIRDTFGLVGDTLLNPITYLALSDDNTGIMVQSLKIISDTSLKGEQYEDFKESSFDPYTAMRDFYTESRRSKIADRDRFITENNSELKSLKEKAENLAEALTRIDGNSCLAGEIDLNNIEKMTNTPTLHPGLLDSYLMRAAM